MAKNYLEFYVRIETTTDLAALCEFVEIDDPAPEEWIPFSQILDEGEGLAPDYEGTIEITEWIAEQKGLI